MLDRVAPLLASLRDRALPDLTEFLLIALPVLGGLWLARRIVRREYARRAATPQAEVLEIPLLAASRTSWAFLLVVAAYFGSGALTLSPKYDARLDSALAIAFFWQCGLWTSTAASAWLDLRRQVALRSDKAAAGSIGILRFLARVAVWVMVALLTLDNLGIDITALVAGLGIGGIAVALAVQNVLGDLLASLSIALDQPFVIGDFLVVGEHMGSVEYIGIKSTRIRSLSGEQIVMSNADLLGGRLRNYGRMQERRVVFSVGVTYDTPPARLAALPALLREIICSEAGVRFDRAHFARLGSYALEFECVYYVLSADYNRYMDVQQSVNLRIMERLAADHVELAFPTSTVRLQREAA